MGSKKGQTQSSGGGNLQITLSSDAAKELLQALTAAVGSGGGKGKATDTGKPKATAKPKASAKSTAKSKSKSKSKS